MTSSAQPEPLFSVVIPTYNRAHSLLATLDSCWRQRCQDFEVIVVDDGSSDNTVNVIHAIHEPRLRFVRQTNAGPAAARNRGISEARGRYIAFLDSDDLWYPEHLQNASAALDAAHHPDNAFLYTQIIVDRGVGRYWLKPDRAIRSDENIFDYLYVHGGFIQTSTIVVARQLTEAVRWDVHVTFGDNDQFAIDLYKAGALPVMLPRAQTLYADCMSTDALSQLPLFGGNTSRHTNFLGWMAGQREFMSQQSLAGFRGKFESVALARRQPVHSLQLIWQAYRSGAIGIKGMFRQALQTFAPRLYRQLVDRFVRWRGAPLDELLD